MSEKVKSNIIAPVRKRLLNLYVLGEEVSFHDDEGEFSVWIQKINSWQDRDAIQKSKVVRAPIIALIKDKANPDRLAYIDLLSEWDFDTKETQIQFLISPKVQQARESAEARIASEDEWAKDDYLITLQEAWVSGLSDTYALNPDDKEANRIYLELRRYTDLVDSAVEHEANEYALDMEDKSEEAIQDQIVTKLIEHEADVVQMAEYHRWCIFYAIRNIDDHDELFFETREEIDYLDQSVYNRLLEAYLELEIAGMEGKD